jgi:hypothetical protein
MHSDGLKGTRESKDHSEVSLRGRIVGGPWVGIPFHCQLAGPLHPTFFVRHVASVSRRAGFNRRTVAPVNTLKIDVPSDLQPAHCGQHWLHRTLGDVMKALFLESVVMAAAVTVSVGLTFFTLEVVLVVLDAAL